MTKMQTVYLHSSFIDACMCESGKLAQELLYMATAVPGQSERAESAGFAERILESIIISGRPAAQPYEFRAFPYVERIYKAYLDSLENNSYADHYGKRISLRPT